MPPIAALACTVRGCGLPLSRDGLRLVCPERHAFDVARSGYVNLAQPQDRRSPTAGDARDAVEARARLLAAGVGQATVEAVVDRLPMPLSPGAVVVDLGCGSGELIGAVAARHAVDGIGIDLSVAAVERAARRFPHLTWVVANADRRLPLLDASVCVVLSLNGRRNPSECARVLVPGGMLIVAVPAPDDLVELRGAVQGATVERGRADDVIAAHAPLFTVTARFTVRERHRLDAEALRDLLRGTYRGARHSTVERVRALDAMETTLATDVCVLRR